MSETKKPERFEDAVNGDRDLYDADEMDAYFAAQPRAWAWEMLDGTFAEGLLFRVKPQWNRMVPGQWAQVRIVRDADE